MRRSLLFSFLCGALLASCDLQQEIDLDLPEYEPQIVVESYLVPNQIFALTLTKSQSYFDPASLVFVKNADVKIRYGGVTEQLQFASFPLSIGAEGLEILEPLLGDSLFVYLSANPVPELYNVPFELEVVDTEGTRLTASTIIPPPVPIDTLEWSFNDDSLAFVLARFQDNPDIPNFYRTIFREGSAGAEASQDIYTNDEITNGQEQVFGTPYEFEVGDTIYSTVYHITEDYYNFLDINERAFQANLSPFGQPSSAFSNISGGLGIFTGYSLDQKIAILTD